MSRLAIALLTFSLVEAPEAFAWGNEGHIYVNRVAAEKIPRDMPRFLAESRWRDRLSRAGTGSLALAYRVCPLECAGAGSLY